MKTEVDELAEDILRALPDRGTRLLDAEDMAAFNGWKSADAVYQGMHRGHFPPPIKISPRGYRWVPAAVARWYAERCIALKAKSA